MILKSNILRKPSSIEVWIGKVWLGDEEPAFGGFELVGVFEEFHLMQAVARRYTEERRYAEAFFSF